MTAENQPLTPARPRRLLIAIAALLVVAAAAFFAMRRPAPAPAAADCDNKKPPATSFAIEECDQGAAKTTTAPGASGQAAPAGAARP